MGRGWLELGLKRARGVARVETATGRGFGSGFLVRGSDLRADWGQELVLITNAHVVSDTYPSALRDSQAQVRFHALEGDAVQPRKVELLWTSPPMPAGLDTSVLRLEPPVTGVEPCPLRFDAPEGIGTKRLYIIGYPGGGDLSFSINDNLLIGWKDPRLHYRTPTEPGSSGGSCLRHRLERDRRPSFRRRQRPAPRGRTRGASERRMAPQEGGQGSGHGRAAMRLFLAFAFRPQDKELVGHVEQLPASHYVQPVTGEGLGGEQLKPSPFGRWRSGWGSPRLLEDLVGAGEGRGRHAIGVAGPPGPGRSRRPALRP